MNTNLSSYVVYANLVNLYPVVFNWSLKMLSTRFAPQKNQMIIDSVLPDNLCHYL